MDIQDIDHIIEENEKDKAKFKTEKDAETRVLQKIKKMMEKQIEEATKPQ